MTNPSDLQTLMLSAASQRETGSLLPAPDTIPNAGARITKALAGLIRHGLAEERDTADAAAMLRADGDRLIGVFITAAGAEAIGVGEPADADPDVGDTGPAHNTTTLPSPPASVVPDATKPPRQTKSAAVLTLLQRTGGATTAELIAATGWLPHTLRAALTGLRHKGHAIERGKRDGATCYTVTGAA